MNLTNGQNRFINNKSMGVSFIKGKKNCGKTTASIYRTINLENNYCLLDNEKILYLTCNNDKLSYIKQAYDNLKGENYFYSLFSAISNKVEINTMQDFILENYKKYYDSNNSNCNYINNESLIKIIENDEFNDKVNSYRKKIKLFKAITTEDILDEILWIKACDFSLNEYLTCNRVARKLRIRKSSSSRLAFYELYNYYNKVLFDNSYIDSFDRLKYAKEGLSISNTKYTHIIVDSAEKILKSELELLKTIINKTCHSSVTFIINTDEEVDQYGWFIKGRKFQFLNDEYKSKNYLFKTPFNSSLNKEETYMDKYKYINLKYKNEVIFNIDNLASSKEIYTDSDILFKENELKEIPVYNEIAAGNPIEMNDSITDNFYLPNSWLERGKDTFILQVKGDSMIDKNIHDGDFVVIKKQPTANNNEIVAATIDGEATLKILNTNEKYPKLVPANVRYKSINLVDKDVSILGVAIGVIKFEN